MYERAYTTEDHVKFQKPINCACSVETEPKIY